VERFNMRTPILMLPFLVLVVFGCAEMEQKPLSAEAYRNRGITYGERGQYDQAISDFNKAIEINPRDAYAYNNRGTAYMKSGNKEKACSDWKRACELGDCRAGKGVKP
jgi:Flp pilus assembly protein TadD